MNVEEIIETHLGNLGRRDYCQPSQACVHLGLATSWKAVSIFPYLLQVGSAMDA